MNFRNRRQVNRKSLHNTAVVVTTLIVIIYILVKIKNSSKFINVSIRNEAIYSQCFENFIRIANIDNETSFFLNYFKIPLPISNLSPTCQSYFQPPTLTTEDLKVNTSCFKKAAFSSRGLEALMYWLAMMKLKLDKNRMTVILVGSSLIGSVRHHGLIPFNEDMAFAVPRHQVEDVKTVLRRLAEELPKVFFLNETHNKNSFQFIVNSVPFSQESKVVEERIVANFFWFSCGTIGSGHCWMSSDVQKIREFYPLVVRPFGGMLFNVTKDYKDHVRSSDKSSNVTCTAKMNGRNRCESVPCRILYRYIPFVVKFVSVRVGGVLELCVEQGHIIGFFFSHM